MEFEGAKHEARRLGEDVELLHQQVAELSSLKKIAEKQLEEALESLQVPFPHLGDIDAVSETPDFLLL